MAGAGAAELGKTAVTSATEEAAKQGLTGEAYNQAVQNSVASKMGSLSGLDKLSAGFSNPAATMNAMGGGSGLLKTGMMAAAPMLMGGVGQTTPAPTSSSSSKMPQRLRYESGAATTTPAPDVPAPGNLGQDFNQQQSYFPNAGYQNISDEEAKRLRGYAYGGPIQELSDRDEAQTLMANNGQMFAKGGLSHLGDYSDGGRMLRGPGDGVSDSIPATIGGKRPARLADGEFVVPARIVSELGNGSSEAGARKLYAMMDRVQKARKKSIGKGNVAKNSRADRLLPA